VTVASTHLFRNRRKPQMMSNIPTITATATMNSVFITLSRFTVPVVVRSARSSIMNPVKERNPPRAILSRCLSGKYDIALSQPIISIAGDNVFAPTISACYEKFSMKTILNFTFHEYLSLTKHACFMFYRTPSCSATHLRLQ